MSKEKDSDFKVVDKRFSAGGESPSPKKAEGEGFVMKESPKETEPTYQIDFSTFVLSLATGALINLGLAPDPITKKTQKNTSLAQQNIEILVMMQDKTKGNLSKDEADLLNNLLTEIRLRFVEATR